MARASGLDLLRAIAIGWVMWSHLTTLDLLPPSDQVARFGWMGVDLFFVLSGFLIGTQLLKPRLAGEPLNPGRFYLKRAMRILPAYLVVVALYFTVPVFRERADIQPLWQFLTFTENLLIDFHTAKAFSHVWSLCVEEQFYVVAPVLVWLVMRKPSLSKGLLVCGAILIAGMALRAWIWTHDLPPHHPHSMGRLYMERIYYPTWTRLDGLVAGMVLALLGLFAPRIWAGIAARANLVAAAGAGGVGLSIWVFQDQSDFWPTAVGYPLLAASFAALVAAGAASRGWLATVRIPGAGAMAAIAYSLYLVHKAVYHLTSLALGPWGLSHPNETVAIAVLASLAAGAALYWAVERLFLKLRDRLTARLWPTESRAARIEGVAAA